MKKKWLEQLQKWRGALGKYQYVALVAAVGVILMLLPAGGTEEPAVQEPQAGEETFDLEEFEGKLEEVLSQVEGAGETQVVLPLAGGSRQVLAQDTQRDADGGGSTTVVTVGRGSGSQEALPLQTVAPEFRGALVVCPGGGDPQVKLRLIEAVSALTGLGASRVSVCQGGG